MKKRIALGVTTAFVVLAPLATFVLLQLRGLPSFAVAHLWDVLVWVYQVTWLAALMSGALASGAVIAVVSRTSFFHRPYDFGRCFSLGAIVGAGSEALATWTYRAVSGHPFSGFWIAGAMMAGCLSGAAIMAGVLWQVSKISLNRGLRK